MKRFRTIAAGAIVLLAMAMPSISSAQYPERGLDKFLDEHQNVKAELMRDPNLIYDRKFRHEHPELQAFMQNHPQVWGKLPGYERFGGYGPDHAWHEADWWHDHDPGWMYSHHPEWADNHPEWRADRDSHPEWFHHAGAEEPHGQEFQPAHHEQAYGQTNPQNHEHHHDNSGEKKHH